MRKDQFDEPRQEEEHEQKKKMGKTPRTTRWEEIDDDSDALSQEDGNGQ